MRKEGLVYDSKCSPPPAAKAIVAITSASGVILTIVTCLTCLCTSMRCRAQVQCQLKSWTNGQYYSPYKPGMGPGEIGVATVSPGNVSPAATVGSSGQTSGLIQAIATTQYLPESNIYCTESETYTCTLPKNASPLQTIYASASIGGYSTNGGLINASMTSTIPGFNNPLLTGLNGQDTGGHFTQEHNFVLTPTTPQDITITCSCMASPLPSGGETGMLNFQIAFSTTP